MPNVDRRRALGLLTAGAAGIAAAAAPDLWHAGPSRSASASGGHKGGHHGKGPAQPPDPGYAHGQPMQALHLPVRSLQDLSPTAPANAIALTIDDGPHPKYTPMMLDLLAAHGVKATFNMIGEQVVEQPKIVQRIVADGHQIADHTVTHPINLPRLDTARITREIGQAHDQIAQTTGVAPKFFRSPGGNWSQAVFDIAAQHKLICVDWKIDPRDWARPGISHITRTMLQAQPGDILLCHDGGGDRIQTIDALKTVLPQLKQRGLQFVAL
ncbi:polysaccharide deacetylase family protein [Actinomadura gamaensis]|uniref:Polysaccharide deacetylase family protein n=1 Tax=Actinomadura gamaensis TaxID=1763541 RepID=A0ABV9TQ42_9ACTN